MNLALAAWPPGVLEEGILGGKVFLVCWVCVVPGGLGACKLRWQLRKRGVNMDGGGMEKLNAREMVQWT